ncbi:ABC transporter ATP-binding protein [Actinorhabdospora filicis]|uniref:ABC transporter ATP-binding protein n=1 Tax=Actinorhabdospora filicis TaxID=1785913 RepID=A0A9W6SJC5_9ACTN|nr:ABC-F family ATP-binding cassette domain-containing protein [Actinorhabdospora filicis]GLZ76644.1 ABC transporter ATP-binding protein [Actinorhabdospora filicis]
MRTSALTASHLVLDGVTRRYGDRVVLDRVSLSVKPGEKAAVIGDNGAGKSTLLRLMTGREDPDNGTVSVHAPGGTGHLAQTDGLPASATVGDLIDLALAGLRELDRLMREAEADLSSPAALERYAALAAAFEARDGYRADQRVEAMLHHLGGPSPDRARPLGTLSGGERARLNLAATLASAPELLLLDEPTNDLDDEAVAWLEDHLRDHPGTLVAVTHDREFLARVSTTILEVAEHRVRRYGGGHDGYLTAKATERQTRLREHREWREEIRRQGELATSNAIRLEAIPRKGPWAFSGAGAFRARSRHHGAMSRVRDARERLTRLTAAPKEAPPEPLRFSGRPQGDGVATSLSGAFARGIRLPDLRLEPGGRLLVTGPNGSGKSTLLAVLAGELDGGPHAVRHTGRVGHLRQRAEPTTDARTLLAAYAEGLPGVPEDHADGLLALGLFHPGDLDRAVRDLSIGQRRRLELARVVAAPVDLLLLDEPTNHLTPELADELEAALAEYPGAVVLVSHDRRMRRGFGGTRLVM